MTLTQAIKIGSDILNSAGIENPEFNSRYLLTALLDKNLLYPVSCPHHNIENFVFTKFMRLVRLRSKNHPTQYLIGKQWFRELQIKVGPGCFIPRPETELIVEQVLTEFSPEDKGIIIEICTGSGAIAIDLANNLPQMNIMAMDISARGLIWAKKNQQNLSAYDNLTLVNADLLNCIISHHHIRAIVVNPPYIPSEQIKYLSPEIQNHEPHLAVDGGEAGLEVIEEIICQCASILPEKASLYMELGHNQHNAVQKLLLQQGFNDIVFYKDFMQYNRIVRARINEII
ncbi:MAG: peptide chain release factor N(5)-glutamine methyltransferase [bacterium]